MSDESRSAKRASELRAKTPEKCPHCGRKLSPWEQVLLSVDRVLMCNHCWYRIILDVADEVKGPSKEDKPKR